MRRLFAALAALFLFAGPAFADVEGATYNPGNAAARSALQGCLYRASPVTAVDGQQMAAGCDANGNMTVTLSLRDMSTLPSTVATGILAAGNVAQYRAVLPTYTDGQFGATMMNPKGSINVAFGPSGAGDGASATSIQSYGSDGNSALLGTLPYGFGGATTDRFRTITGVIAAGTGNTAVDLAPTSAATAGNVPTATAAVASNLVVKGTPGNLYSWVVTSGASAGYVMIFNATTLPADGAVTPADCRVIAANSTIGSGNYDIPERYSAGIVIGFSTTGCFSKTASATAYIRATFQ